MKRIFYTLIALFVTIVANAQITEIYEYENGKPKSEPTYVFNKKVKIVVKEEIHEYVDLGLPSGTLWATCNVGASKPEEYGDYFAWGETEPKDRQKGYMWKDYKWMMEGQKTEEYINKYTVEDKEHKGCWYDHGTFIGDGKLELDPEDDAATVNWGSDWCMPTLDQIDELCSPVNVTCERAILNKKHGIKITSKKNGNSIFLPSAGYYYDRSYMTDLPNDPSKLGSGLYWSRSLAYGRPDIARFMYILYNANKMDWTNEKRFYGMSVRPVRVKK